MDATERLAEARAHLAAIQAERDVLLKEIERVATALAEAMREAADAMKEWGEIAEETRAQGPKRDQTLQEG